MSKHPDPGLDVGDVLIGERGVAQAKKSNANERILADRLKQLDEHLFALLQAGFLSMPQYLGKHFAQPTDVHWLALGKKITELVHSAAGHKGRVACETAVAQAAKCAQGIVLCLYTQSSLEEVRACWAKADAAVKEAA